MCYYNRKDLKLKKVFYLICIVFLSGCGGVHYPYTYNPKSDVFVAVKNNNLNLLQNLISNNVDLNIQDKYGYTPLIESIYGNNTKSAELLIKGGANLDLVNKNGDTALTLAIQKNNNFIVELLVQNGADLNITNNDGNTALDIAQKQFNISLVNFLAQKGAVKSIDTKVKKIEKNTEKKSSEHTFR